MNDPDYAQIEAESNPYYFRAQYIPLKKDLVNYAYIQDDPYLVNHRSFGGYGIIDPGYPTRVYSKQHIFRVDSFYQNGYCLPADTINNQYR